MFVYITACLYLVLSKTVIHEVLSTVAIIDKGIFPVNKGSIGVQFYVDVENVHQRRSCRIHSWPKMCCLEDEPYKDCYTDNIFGDNIESIKPNARETLIYVYPTLYQHDQIGYCEFIVDFKCGKQKRSTQLNVNIPFNTKISIKKPPEYLKLYSDEKRRQCDSLDEDVFNDCAPVNCDLKYSGRRPFFDIIRSKCIIAPNCETDVYKDLPDLAYVPKSNICRDLDHTLTLNDIYAISTGLGVVTEATNTVPNGLKVQLKSNCSTISQNIVLLKDLMTGQLCPLFNGDTTEYCDCCKTALLSILACVISICALLLSIICCIHVTVCLYKKWSNEQLKNMLLSWKSKIMKDETVPEQQSRLSRDLTNNLLKEVIVRDLPIELRGSIVDICDKIGKEVSQKKRYRMLDLGSQINLIEAESDSRSASSSARSEHDDEE